MELTCEYWLHNTRVTRVKAAKDHGENYIRFRHLLVYHLYRNRLLVKNGSSLPYGVIRVKVSFKWLVSSPSKVAMDPCKACWITNNVYLKIYDTGRSIPYRTIRDLATFMVPFAAKNSITGVDISVKILEQAFQKLMIYQNMSNIS